MGRLLREAKRDRKGRADDIGAPVTAATMPANKDGNWVRPLLKMAGMRDPWETRGRRKALVKKATYKSQRSYEDLIQEVLKIGESKPHIKTKKGIYRELALTEKYKNCSDRTLRRDMDAVFPPHVWRSYQGWLASQRDWAVLKRKIAPELARDIRGALALPDRPGISAIAKKFGVSHMIVRTIQKLANK
jgi:hypothetical protein